MGILDHNDHRGSTPNLHPLPTPNKSPRQQSYSSHQSSSSARPTSASYPNGKLPASVKKQATSTSDPKWIAGSPLLSCSSAPSVHQPSSSSYHQAFSFFLCDVPSSSASSTSSSRHSPPYSSNHTTSQPVCPASPISESALAWPYLS